MRLRGKENPGLKAPFKIVREFVGLMRVLKSKRWKKAYLSR
jgi:hypothetical protein